MLYFKRINTQHPSYSWMEQIWESSFPPEERRATDEQRKKSNETPIFHTDLIHHNQQPIGLIYWWELERFRYIEHFAIAPQHRNKQYGSQTIQTFCQQDTRPILLEVEPATDQLTLRRIHFYKALGFALHANYPYLQPPYPGKKEAVPLQLMTWGEKTSITNLQQLTTELKIKVYEYKGIL